MIVADLGVSTSRIIESKDVGVVRDYVCRKQCMCVDRECGIIMAEWQGMSNVVVQRAVVNAGVGLAPGLIVVMWWIR